MKKKILIGLGIVGIMLVTLYGIKTFFPTSEKEIGNKTLQIVVVDGSNGGVELFNGSIKTDAEMLAEALLEAKELKVVAQNSTYGRFISSMCGVEQGPIESGPWWLYESDNNETCKAQGMCIGIDETVIKDGDKFVFTLTSNFK